MDDKSLEILDFPKIKQMVAGFTSFDAGRQMMLDLQPLHNHQQIALLLQQSAEARQLLTMESGFSIEGMSDIRAEAKMAALGRTLEPQSLQRIQETLSSILSTRNRLQKLAAELPLLWSIAAPIAVPQDVIRNIERSLGPDGEVLDHASDRLAGIRRQLVVLRQRLLERLEAIMKSTQGQKMIQEPVISEREGRYVIPIKVEHRREVKGIVHDVSNTGATIFVEPWAVMEQGNALRELAMEEVREVERILHDLSAAVGAHEAEISRDITLMAELDFALAKARYARRYKAIEPELVPFDANGAKPVLKLIEARHPLLADAAVPLTVEMGTDFLVLVITGPNTGGKTVALKTVGLLSVMALSGLPIPVAAGSRIPVFDGVFADIGDEQSIEQTLSTFSWHIGNIVHIIGTSTDRSLVLLDELGASTDPVEGSALAISILRHFLSRRTLTVATTHFSELKAFAHTTPGIQNASFDFDPVTLTPTYHLTIGTPGGSNALAIATRLGLPADIIAEAERILPEGIKELETLLVSLKTRERELTAVRRQMEKEREEAVRQKTEFEMERGRLQTEMRQMIREARDKVIVEVAELNREIRDTAAAMRKEHSKQSLEQARKTLGELQEKLKTKVLQPQHQEEEIITETITVTAVSVGDTVLVKEMGMTATVLAVSEERQEVELQAGRAKLTLSLDKVTKATSRARPSVMEYVPLRPSATPRTVPRELDLRGKRADEIASLLDKYLNDASVTNQIEVRIIHGFGTGAVRQIVRDLLSSHPLVRSFRPGKRDEGGDGATVVQL